MFSIVKHFKSNSLVGKRSKPMISTVLAANRKITMQVSHTLIQQTFHITTTLVSRLLAHPGTKSDVRNSIEHLDIEATIRTGEALVRELTNTTLERESIRVSLRYLHRSIEQLNQYLQDLEDELTRFSNLWFQWLRSQDTASHMEHIKVEFDLMQQRLDMLIRLLQTIP